jgi:hypothetical protein
MTVYTGLPPYDCRRAQLTRASVDLNVADGGSGLNARRCGAERQSGLADRFPADSIARL